MAITLISSQTLGSSATSISFTSIPQTYTDLFLMMSLRGDLNNPQIGHFLRFNGDSTSTYSDRQLSGNGSTTSSGSNGAGGTAIYTGQAPALTQTANTFGNTSIYIPNYTSSAVKAVSVDNVRENDSAASIAFIIAGKWTGTSAITSLSIVCEANNWIAGSSISLYGVTKGSSGTTTVA